MRSDDDYPECPVPHPTAHSGNGLQDAQGPAEPVLVPIEHNFPSEVWAAFFQKYPGDINPLLRWLKQEMSGISSDGWWDVHVKQSITLGFLCKYGLDEATLLEKLQPSLRGFTARFVRRLIIIAVALYGPEICQQQDHQDVLPVLHEGRRTALQLPPIRSLLIGLGCSTSPAGPSTEDLPGIFYGGSGHPTTTPMSSEEPQEEPGHAAAVGSSTQCRDCLSGGVSESPEKEGQQQPPGLAPTLQEAALAAALSQNPTTSQTTAQADWEASGRWLWWQHRNFNTFCQTAFSFWRYSIMYTPFWRYCPRTLLSLIQNCH